VFPLLLAVLKKGRQYTELVLVSRPSILVVVSESSKWDVNAVPTAGLKKLPVPVLRYSQ
jgi:hypothetical protein